MVLLLAEVVPVVPPPRLVVAFDITVVPELDDCADAKVEEAVCATDSDRREHEAKKSIKNVLILTAG